MAFCHLHDADVRQPDAHADYFAFRHQGHPCQASKTGTSFPRNGQTRTKKSPALCGTRTHCSKSVSISEGAFNDGPNDRSKNGTLYIDRQMYGALASSLQLWQRLHTLDPIKVAARQETGKPNYTIYILMDYGALLTHQTGIWTMTGNSYLCRAPCRPGMLR